MPKWRSLTDSERRRLAERLRQAREDSGMTQREVAGALGIPQSTMSELENAQRRLDVAELLVLADLYRKPVMWFLDAKAQSAGEH